MNGEIGRRARELRELLGLTQEEVAGRALVARNTIARIERGDRIPGIGTLARIAAALGVTEQELLGRSDRVDELHAAALQRLIVAARPLGLYDQNLLATMAERLNR